MTVDHILKIHQVKGTGCRKHILHELLQSDIALSEQQLKDSLPYVFDRVTFYRSLRLLEEKQIIHRIVLHDGSIKYALNREINKEEQHAHFHCVDCGRVICLKDIVGTDLQLPVDFLVKSTLILIEGSCPKCRIEK